MKVDGSLKSLLQGVSQQPPRDRLPGQCTDQLNMSSDPVTGLTRRPPTDLVGPLLTSSNVRGWHNFETRNGSKFLSCIHDGIVSVWDYNAAVKTVTMTAGGAYLHAAGDFRFGTIEDDTIIVNNRVTPAMTSAVKTYLNKGAGSTPSAIIQVLGGAYGRTYTITINGTVAATVIPNNGSNQNDVYTVRTSAIAIRLVDCLVGAAGTSGEPGGSASGSWTRTGVLSNTTNWGVTRVGDLIYIQSKTGTAFTISGTDDSGNVNMKVMYETVTDSSDLPALAPYGYLIRVAKETDPQKDLFLQYFLDSGVTTIGAGFGGTGYWQEVQASSTPYVIDKATMPTKLTYDQVADTFKHDVGTWNDRSVGTTVSNPDPSFIGNPIQDVSSFQSRLVFLAGSNVIMSRTKHRNDFWYESAAADADTDPVDISSTAVEASLMLAAVPHNRDLIVFSKQGQFVVFGRTAITPTNAALVLTTAFEAELQAKPVPAGRNVFFSTNYGQFTGVREFYAEGNSDINDSRPITQHVNQYIRGKTTRLSASSNYNMLLTQTDDDTTVIYPYQYIWSDTDKVQAAWSKWKFWKNCVYSFFDEELIYFVMKDGNDYYLLRMSLDVQPALGLDYTIYLDERFDVVGLNTQFLVPANRLGAADLQVVQGAGCPNPGLLAPVKSIIYSVPDLAYKVTLKSSLGGGNVVVGVPYRSEYRPTMPFVKDASNVVIGTATLRVKAFLVSLKETGYIAGQLLSRYGAGPVVEFAARVIGDVGNILGKQPLSNEQFVMPFRDDVRNADVLFYTDTHLPMTLLDVEWEGQYNKRGKRISTGA